MKPAKKKKKTNWKHWLPFYLMGLPGFIYLFINNYMPLMGLQIAFKDFKYNLAPRSDNRRRSACQIRQALLSTQP